MSVISTRTVIASLALAGLSNAADLSALASLLSFRPDEGAQSRLINRPVAAGEDPWHIQKVERARGELILESTSLLVSKLPAVNDKVLSPHGLVAYVRHNMGQFMEGENIKFGPVTGEDTQLLSNESAVNAVVEFTATTGADPRQSAWLFSEVRKEDWTLSSVQVGGKDKLPNPFNGNRRFGVRDATPMDGTILYSDATVRAFDAPTPDAERALAAQSAEMWRRIFGRIEAWIIQNGGAVVPNLVPQQSTIVTWASVAKSMHVPHVAWQDLDGTWRSKDAGKRFSIVFRGIDAPCDFMERNADGGEIRVQVPLQAIQGEKDKQGQPIATYVIERSNEEPDVLKFYKFSAQVITDIIAANPKPSKLILRREGDKLTGEWLGLAISRDGGGRLSSIKNPGDQPGRTYEFVADGP
jgi:hypothetical protein